MTSLVTIGRFVNGSATRVHEAIGSLKVLLVFVALGLPLTSAPRIDEPLPLPGSVSVFVSDVLVVLAIGLWLLERVFVKSAARPLGLATPVLGWPLAAFAVALVPGIVRGHERFDASLVGQPARLILYAGIAAAMTSLTARTAYRGLTVILYAGAAWQAVLGSYSLATGSSRTSSFALSTGGTRVIALSVAMYMSAALVLALLNLELDTSKRGRRIHIAAASLALIAIVLAFGRTTFLALLLLLPFLAWYLRDTRRWFLGRWKIWVPVTACAAVAVGLAMPSLGTTFVDRVSANPLQDHTVRWRAATIGAALAGFRSGEWAPPAEVPRGGNQLANPGFEDGTESWLIQGGTLGTVPSNNPRFGALSLRMQTAGESFDEGFYSLPVLTSPGQSWRFSVWLSGAVGGEPVYVAIWEYGLGGKHTGYSNLPVEVGPGRAHYSVTTTVKDPETVFIRALVRTRDGPQRVVVYADNASLTPLSGSPDARLTPTGSQNVLQNSSFERGTDEWLMQGGTLTPVPSFDPELGRLAIKMETQGVVEDEGLYSPAVPTRLGDRWTFAVWLKGAVGGEIVDVAIWHYDKRGDGIVQVRAPVLLTTKPGRYLVSTTVTSRRAIEIRALVRTWDHAQAVAVLADEASLELVGAAPVPQAPAQSGGGSAPRQASSSGVQVDEPLLGVGFGRSFDFIWEGGVYHLDGDPHNSFVWILAGGGILALAMFFLLQIAFLRDGLRRTRHVARYDRALVVWALAAWFIIMVNTLTEPVLSEPALLLTFWIVLLLPALVRKRSSGWNGAV